MTEQLPREWRSTDLTKPTAGDEMAAVTPMNGDTAVFDVGNDDAFIASDVTVDDVLEHDVEDDRADQ
jgi:hypothetical protein